MTKTKKNKKIYVTITFESGEIKRVSKIVKSTEEWKRILTPHQYRITREKGTDKPRFGQFKGENKHGIYYCICCDIPLFSSETKYESGTGWPSFYQPFSKHNIKIIIQKK